MQLLLSGLCLALTSAIIGNAYLQKKQFYPTVVYITKSNASMAVIYLQFFVIVFMFGKLLRKIFLGTLRTAEFELLLERFWYALTETCLAFTVFRDDFNPRFVALFTVLLFLKSFHWLAEERVDFMERSPVLGWLFHVRVGSLLTMLGLLDYVLLMHAYNSTLVRGPTVQLVFGFEYAIQLTVVASTAIKYVLHAVEMRTDSPWENKAVFLLYTGLVIGLIRVILYLLFVVIMAKIYALPMFVFRPMFFTIRNFRKALNDVIMSRRAIRNMNTLYPDATPEELRQSDNICIICREDMINHSKKLPCGHIFHTICLRSWFQRQQTCPTCRLNILRTPAINSTAMQRPAEDPANAPAPVAAAQPAAAVNPVANFLPGATPVPAPDAGAARPNGTAVRNPAAPTFADLVRVANGLPNALPNIGGIPPPPPMLPPFMMQPPFPYFTPPLIPPPPMPQDLNTFNEEELLAMEGNLRQHIQERIKLLRNISLMVDSANILMHQYQGIIARLPPPVQVLPSVADAATGDAANAASTVSTAPTVPVNTSTSYDKPSTSRAAATAAESKPLEAHQVTVAPIDPAAKVSEKVTIEDLGAEEDVLVSTDGSNVDVDNDDSAELSELRKRRLKFLEERNKSPTVSDKTD